MATESGNRVRPPPISGYAFFVEHYVAGLTGSVRGQRGGRVPYAMLQALRAPGAAPDAV